MKGRGERGVPLFLLNRFVWGISPGLRSGVYHNPLLLEYSVVLLYYIDASSWFFWFFF
jgi:hypothetical protein